MLLMEMAQRFSIDHDFLPKKKSNALLYQRRGVHSILRLDFTFPSNSFRNSAPSYQDIIARAFFFCFLFFFWGGGFAYVCIST